MELTFLAAMVPLILGVLLIGLAVAAFRRGRGLSGGIETLTGLLMLAIAFGLGAVGVGMRSYRALNSEQTAATMFVSSEGRQEFDVRFEFPDGTSSSYRLAGDQLYVDARILKWHPLANILGLQTAYQLDRVAGRYQAFEDEANRPRTVFELGESEPVDLFALVQRFPFLASVVDAEYGSASFVPVVEDGIWQLRVSPTGLLIRRLD